MEIIGFEFDPTNFYADTKFYIIAFDNGGRDMVDVILKFGNKKIVYMDLGDKAKMSIHMMELRLNYQIHANFIKVE